MSIIDMAPIYKAANAAFAQCLPFAEDSAKHTALRVNAAVDAAIDEYVRHAGRPSPENSSVDLSALTRVTNVAKAEFDRCPRSDDPTGNARWYGAIHAAIKEYDKGRRQSEAPAAPADSSEYVEIGFLERSMFNGRTATVGRILPGLSAAKVGNGAKLYARVPAPSPLQSASTDDLIRELKKRCGDDRT